MIETIFGIFLFLCAVTLILGAVGWLIKKSGDLQRRFTDKPLPPDSDMKYQDLAGDD